MLSHTVLDGVAVARVEEKRIDASRAPNFKEALGQVIADGHNRLVLDLSGVEFVDSSGLGAIVSCLKRLGPRGSLAVAGAHGAVTKLFALTRMDKVFPLFPDVDSAVAKLND